ncbi:glycosyltransferase family 2 protein [Variovorax sp. HJSM1_2]|uniref:glycosyltransferase family 2 protein n=1 Tax=Variovorax sp. HJSM1_2 TaxID=3366263 RepID=UPI003BCA3BB3
MKTKLTVVAPVFNEESVIAHFYERTRSVLNSIENTESQIIFVVDRSTDKTVQILRDIAARDSSVIVITLSSRFGHQMSLLAGIDYAKDADCIVMMDSDLQHPPELIPAMLEKFTAGSDVVFTIRESTEGGSFIRRAAGNLFYKMLGAISKVPINANAADFRLISRRVAKTLSADFEERNMFLRGLFSWIGFNQDCIEYQAERRFAGHSKYSFSRTLKLAAAGILSFSTRPLHVGIFVGVGFALLAFLYALFSVVFFFIDRSIPSGWTTLIAALLLFSGIQLIILGIMGAYIGGIYEEVKKRPHYIIDEVIKNHD